MKTTARALFLLLCVFSLRSFGVIEIGQTVPNMCWTDVNGSQVCLHDHADNVRVLIYSAGWCVPCNQEMDELAKKVGQFAGEPVTFISLSGAGWNAGSEPDRKFLEEWREKHDIPFTVAASPNDFGVKFFSRPRIPSVVVVGKNGKLALKEIYPSVDGLLREIKGLLQ